MNKIDKFLRDTLIQIKENGVLDQNVRAKYKDDTPAISKYITHVVHSFDISKGEFPIPTLRNTAVRGGIKEILWIYQMQSNKLADLHDMGVNWWDDWEVKSSNPYLEGTIGYAYGYVVHSYDMMYRLLDGLVRNPFGRRHILNLWQHVHVTDQDDLKGLNPCFYSSTFSTRLVDGVYYLDILLNSRSSDLLVAGAINFIQYTALTMMICSHLRYETGKNWQVGQLTVVIANCHTYLRHEPAVEEVLAREPLENNASLSLNVDKNFYDIKVEDFGIINHKHLGKLINPLELAI